MEFDGVVFHYENKQSLEFSLVYFVNIELNWDDSQERRRKREEFLPRTSPRRLHDTRSLHNPLKVHALQLTFILFLSSRRVRLLFIVNNPARDFVSAHILHHSPRSISTLISSAALVERKSHRWLCFFFEWGDSTPRKNVRLIYCNSARDHAKCFFTIHHWLSARNEQFSTKVEFSFQLLSWPIWSISRETFGVSRAQTTNFFKIQERAQLRSIKPNLTEIYDHSCSNWHFSLHIQSFHREWVSARASRIQSSFEAWKL